MCLVKCVHKEKREKEKRKKQRKKKKREKKYRKVSTLRVDILKMFRLKRLNISLREQRKWHKKLVPRGNLTCFAWLWYNQVGQKVARNFFVFRNTENVVRKDDNLENMLGRNSYVTIPEAAKELNVSTVTVRKWVRNGDLVSTKVKNPRNKQDMSLIHKSELDFFEENVMPKIYHKDRVPRKIKRNKAVSIWDKIKKLLGFD